MATLQDKRKQSAVNLDDCVFLFLSGFFPEDQYEEITSKSKNGVQFAADALQKSLLNGLSQVLPNLEVINCPYIGAWPINYSSIFSPRKSDYLYKADIESKPIKIHNVRFLNIALAKHYFRYRSVIKQIRCFCKANKDRHCVIIVYSITSSFFQAIRRVKKEFENITVIDIATDLPEFMSGNKNGFINRLKKLDQKLLTDTYHYIDGFVVLSKYMKSQLCINGQPMTVVEGIYNPADDIEPSIKNNKKFTILYTGTLDRRYGVTNLVNAVHNIKNEEIELLIAGSGNAQSDIERTSKVDNRIKYLGLLPRFEILKLQRIVDLLVNPRTAEGEFTKYSFPSKTMEYLASGTPVLMYDLPGIPEEYSNYFYSPENNSVESLTAKIEEIMEIDSNVLRQRSLQAREFILSKKNPVAQSQKIAKLIREIINQNNPS